jgi:hypothetical protein
MGEPTKAARPPQFFDGVFHRLMEVSDRALIVFINALFNTDHPLDSPVARLDTEQTTGHGRRRADIIIRIQGAVYHLEAQLRRDTDMAIRVFSYGYEQALKTKTKAGRGWTVTFPPARVIYLEGQTRTPDVETLNLVFPDGTAHAYPVQSLAVGKYGPGELDQMGLDLLLPFSLLRLRRRLKEAPPGRRAKLAADFTGLLQQVEDAVGRGAEAGRMDSGDRALLDGLTELVVEQVFASEYKEIEEAIGVTVQIKTHYEQGLEQGREEGRASFAAQVIAAAPSMNLDDEHIAQLTGLSLDEIARLRAAGPGA